MSHPASTWDFLPGGTNLVRIHVRFRETGGQHVTQFPCFAIEMTDEVGEGYPHTLFYQETTFSPFVFEMVGHLSGLLRSAGMEFEIVNETPLEL